MPIKVNLCDVSITTHSVELSDKCPHCGADLHGAMALISGEYDITEQEFSADNGAWGDYEDGLGDNAYTVYWKCHACRKVLIAGSEHYINEEHPGAAESKQAIAASDG